MTHGKLETVPATWSHSRDDAFFAIVRSVFPPAFTSGATALLMSYDDDGGPCPRSAPPTTVEARTRPLSAVPESR